MTHAQLLNIDKRTKKLLNDARDLEHLIVRVGGHTIARNRLRDAIISLSHVGMALEGSTPETPDPLTINPDDLIV